MSEDMLKWLRFAVEIEEKGLAFYKECLNESRHQQAIELFDYLIKAETGHRRVLKDLIDAVSHGDKAQVEKSVESFLKIDIHIPMFDKDKIEKMIGPTARLTEIFNTAMEFEEKGIELYSDLAKKTDDPELEKLFTKLASDEKRHKKDIKDIGQFVFGVGPAPGVR